MKMPQLTIAFGVVLILLGIIGYIATGMVSVTALIPSFFGIVFLLLGILGKPESRRKMMMHIAVALGALAIVGTFNGIIATISYLGGGEVARPAAVISQAVMSILSILYVAMGVKSFIDARRAQA